MTVSAAADNTAAVFRACGKPRRVVPGTSERQNVSTPRATFPASASAAALSNSSTGYV